MSLEALIAIAGMAAVTIAIRMGGLLVADRLPREGFAAAWLRHIPGAVLAALVAPAIANGGLPEWLAAALAVAAFIATRSLIATMVAGVLAVYLLRLWL
ncbi:Branched-chain amino acid transport protein [Devosia enhydra]|uniref:Branched-chain amino acid transport protein n=1 Tax=Devosia enhydra TaxID=665118 RepID=A0A1K2HZZ8_9HYPH|nr:AzlD domain-containing protein [Devosia enhydra]SFZ85717.1 Branched-chain amino acid transport protein [Devosia enhydra]